MTKNFDAVAWMRRRREEIDREDAGLTWQERSEKTRQLLKNDPLWQRLVGKRMPVSRKASPRHRRHRVKV
jgi:hypothetical protein